MYIAFAWRLGYLHIGRRVLDDYDFGIKLSLGRCVSGALHRFNFTAAWNWLPDRAYRSVLDPVEGVDSSRWTGRSTALCKIGAWQSHVLLIRLRGPGRVGTRGETHS